ncbi:MAG: hypothetical protein JSW02_02300 [candidate division WOR-3 bacterium]|nr:MAG: hypothetical protein JSW02_02300 [candidate division WOR-3 bacterium]
MKRLTTYLLIVLLLGAVFNIALQHSNIDVDDSPVLSAVTTVIGTAHAEMVDPPPDGAPPEAPPPPTE